MKAFKVFLASAVLLAVMAFFASPYWVLYQINQAYQRNDAAGIAKYIDFERVKQSLQPQIQQKIGQAAGLDHLPGALQKWGGQLSAAVSAQAVDAAVNERSIILLMQGKSLKESLQQSLAEYSAQDDASRSGTTTQQIVPEHPPADHAAMPAKEMEMHNAPAAEMLKPKLQAHYTGWNRFEIAAPNDSGKVARFELERSAFSWKMVAIILPN